MTRDKKIQVLAKYLRNPGLIEIKTSVFDDYRIEVYARVKDNEFNIIFNEFLFTIPAHDRNRRNWGEYDDIVREARMVIMNRPDVDI